MKSNDLFIGIVVAKPKTLDALSNATYAYMKQLTKWARQTGYETWLFSDETNDLTGKRLSAELEAYTDDVDGKGFYNRRRILVYFCGHGFGEGMKQVWVLHGGLTKWEDRIDVTGMINVLQNYSPNHISIFSDACAAQTFIGGMSPIFPSPAGPYQIENTPIDQFFAASKGESTYANKDGPMFSQIVGRALLNSPIPNSAKSESYINQGRPNVVSSDSLKKFIMPLFDNFAGTANETVLPLIIPAVRYPEDVYREIIPNDPPPTPPSADTENHRQTNAKIDERDGWLTVRAYNQQLLDISSPVDKLNSQTIFFPDRQVLTKIKSLGPFSDGSSVEDGLIELMGGIDATRHVIEQPWGIYSKPDTGLETPKEQTPQITFDDAQVGLGWGKLEDKINGTVLIRYAEKTLIVPEFANFTTLVYSGHDVDGRVRFKIGGVIDADNHPQYNGVTGYGGILLHYLTDAANNIPLLENIAAIARKNVHDPLTPLALAYFYDVTAQRRSIVEMIEELVRAEKQIAIDLPLLAGLSIEYSQSEKFLTYNGYPLSTQLPILNRGWAQLANLYSHGIFEELEPISRNIGIDSYATFTANEDHESLFKWVQKYFTDFDEKPAPLRHYAAH